MFYPHIIYCTGVNPVQDFILDVYGRSGINAQRFRLNSTLQRNDAYTDKSKQSMF